MATSATQLLTRFSYPKQPGDQPWSIIDVTGPLVYTPISGFNPLSGGQRITAQDFGLQAIDIVVAMGSNDAFASVVAIPLGGTPEVPTMFDGGDFQLFTLMWIELSTGVQVAGGSLSSSVVRLLALGR